jgi:cytoskeletal protein RodZ
MSVFGDTLRQARAQKELTLREAERDLRINRHYLAALEEESFEHLPALTYQRGIVRAYASYLGLDPSRLVTMFEEVKGTTDDDSSVSPATQPMDMPNHWAPNFAIIAFTLIAGAVLLTWLYSAYFNAAPEAPQVIGLQPTVTPVGDDAIYVPSPTPLVPTSTPTPPPSPTPTITPTLEATNTPEAEAQTQAIESTGQSQDGASSDQTLATLPAELPEGEVAIRVTALTDLWIEIAADGELIYQGALPQGESTGWVTGEKFNVYTSSGRNTEFTNHLGQEFTMGTEPGEAFYYL